MWTKRNAPPRSPRRVKFRGTIQYAGMVELVDSVDLGSTAKSVQVRVLLPAPSMGNEKDIAQETPDFIGGFAVSTVKYF